MSDLVKELSIILRKKNLKLATAESCTGGMIAAAMTDLAGSSSVFDRGFVTYSNESKQGMLGVNPEIIKNHGAVSKQCAKEMASGALENSAANITVSVTGIAGPGGGSTQKPIGLVYIGLCLEKSTPTVTQCNFNGSRDQIRQLTRDKALTLLIEAARAI